MSCFRKIIKHKKHQEQSNTIQSKTESDLLATARILQLNLKLVSQIVCSYHTTHQHTGEQTLQNWSF